MTDKHIYEIKSLKIKDSEKMCNIIKKIKIKSISFLVYANCIKLVKYSHYFNEEN